MPLRVGYIFLVNNKDKSYINSSGKDSYITICYFVSEESEDVELELCREVPRLEVTGSWYGNHYYVTIVQQTTGKNTKGVWRWGGGGGGK